MWFIDLWTRDTLIVSTLLFSSVFIVPLVQLLLCFKIKKLFFKLLPTILFSASTLFFWIMTVTARDWAAIAYLIFTVFSGSFLFFDGVSWAVFGIITVFKKLKIHSQGRLL